MAVSVAEAPLQIFGEFTLTLGKLFTVTKAFAELVQPFAFVPVTTYVVVALGFAVTLAPVVALKLLGDQV